MTNTVEPMEQQNVLDDAVQLPLAEPETEPIAPLTELTEAAEPEAAANEEPPKKEPGWIRSRIDKAVQKAIQETEARMTAQFEQTLAPIRESILERQADELVEAGEFRTRERALEYVKLKNGVSVSATPEPEQEQPQRDSKGRFVSQQQGQDSGDPVTKARADLLASQASKIKATKGVDVMQTFNNNPEVKTRVLEGEWDFYDVLEYTQNSHMPSLMRTPNGAGIGANTIANMSDAQFQRLQKNLAEGKIYDAR